MSFTPADFSYAIEATGEIPESSNGSQVLIITQGNVDAAFFSAVKNGGGDIRVSLDDSGVSQIPCYPYLCDTITSELLLFCRVPSYSSGARTLFVFAGNASLSLSPASATNGRYDTFQDYHMYSPEGISDLTVNNETLTPSGITSGTNAVNGVFGRTFTSTSTISHSQASAGESWLYSALARQTALSGHGNICTQSAYLSYAGISSNVSSDLVRYGERGSGRTRSITTSSGLINDQFDYVAGGRSDDNNKIVAVRDTVTELFTSTTSVTSATNIRWGDYNYQITSGFEGELAFLAAKSSARTSSEIKTESSNLTSPATFWVMGDSYNPSGGGGGGGVVHSITGVSFEALERKQEVVNFSVIARRFANSLLSVDVKARAKLTSSLPFILGANQRLNKSINVQATINKRLTKTTNILTVLKQRVSDVTNIVADLRRKLARTTSISFELLDAGFAQVVKLVSVSLSIMQSKSSLTQVQFNARSRLSKLTAASLSLRGPVISITHAFISVRSGISELLNVATTARARLSKFLNLNFDVNGEQVPEAEPANIQIKIIENAYNIELISHKYEPTPINSTTYQTNTRG